MAVPLVVTAYLLPRGWLRYVAVGWMVFGALVPDLVDKPLALASRFLLDALARPDAWGGIGGAMLAVAPRAATEALLSQFMYGRDLLHTAPVATLVVILTVALAFTSWRFAAASFTTGYLSHLLLDFHLQAPIFGVMGVAEFNLFLALMLALPWVARGLFGKPLGAPFRHDFPDWGEDPEPEDAPSRPGHPLS